MQFIEKYRRLIVIVVVVVVVGVVLFSPSKSQNVTDKTKDTATATDVKSDKKPSVKKDNNQQKSTSDKSKTTVETKNNTSDSTKEDAASASGKFEGDAVTYVAQPGDSYTTLVRRAIAAYASATNAKVSKAQAIAAETFATQAAHSPALNVGQKLTIKRDDVSSAVSRAQKLSATEIAAWQVYVPFVDFN